MKLKSLILVLGISVIGSLISITIWGHGLNELTKVKEPLANIMKGGLLYDKWFAELGKPKPSGNHAAYPSTGKSKGSSTWRCKECHGWDYRGKEGAYKSGSHHTGIVGIRKYDGADEVKIVKILQDKNHQFQNLISQSGLDVLAAFVSKGQIDMNKYIDFQSRKAKGDPDRGRQIYQTLCVKCHGSDGKEINFGDDKNPVFIGTVSNKNPWETLHKIRMGQPNEEMPGLIAFPTQDQVDTLKYCQTLPKK